MLLISHRGNLEGPHLEQENSPPYVESALKQGFDVEVDVWYVNGGLFLGHDMPEHEIEKEFLMNTGLWCHAKNIETLEFLMDNNIRCFWHQTDDVALTYPDMFLWTFPNKKLTERSICVHLGRKETEIGDCFGICSDYIESFRK